MKFLCINLLISIFITQNIFSVYQLIDQSGKYSYGIDVVYTPTGIDDCIIQVAANNVIIDLNEHSISQSGFTPGLNGIVLNPGLNNVTIINSLISNITGTGIVVNYGCSNITISNVQTSSCDSGGMLFAGTNLNPIIDSYIDHSQITLCCQTTGTIGLQFSQSRRITVNDLLINGNGINTNLFSGIQAANCNNIEFNGVKILTNIGSSVKGIELIVANRCSFKECVIRENLALSTAFTGVDISGALNLSNYFNNCLVINNVATTACTGVSIASSSSNNIFQGCKANNNLGTVVTGYSLTGGNQNQFIDCMASANVASGVGNDCTGFLINGSNVGILLRCLFTYNTSAANNAYGILFQSASGGSLWEIQDCLCMRNTGVAAANSFGVRVATGSNNLFTRNIAFNNGTLAVNQLSGVPLGAVSTPLAPASSNISTITSPWTNIAASQ